MLTQRVTGFYNIIMRLQIDNSECVRMCVGGEAVDRLFISG